MNARAYQILSDLNNEKNTILELSEKYNVSMRTIRNDLNSINKFLLENGLEPVVISSSGEVILKLEQNKLYKLLENLNFYDYKLSHLERKTLIAYILLMSNNPNKVLDLATVLSVSRATINNDLEELKNEFNDYNLEIRAFSNKGLHVIGIEKDKRAYLRDIKEKPIILLDLLIQHIDKNFFKREDEFSVYNRNIIIKIIKEQLSYFNLKLNEPFLTQILDYIELMIKRNRQGFYSEVSEAPLKTDDFTKAIYSLLTQYFEIEKNDSEERELDMFLEELPFIQEVNQNKYSIQIQFYTRRFIARVSSELEINLSDDFEFYENLSNHLNSIQSQSVLFLEVNPFVEEIVDSNPTILKAVRRNIKEYEAFIGRELSDAELYYIVIHICAALERKHNKNVNPNVVLICNAGIGTTKLLQERLKKHFKFQHIQIMSSNTPIVNQPGTIILSTIELNQPGLSYIKISPLLNDEDLIKIGRRIEIIHNSLSDRKTFEISSIPSSSQLIKQINRLILDEEFDIYEKLDRVNNLLTQYFDIPSSGNPRLYELLTQKFIRLDLSFSNLEEAVRAAGSILQENGVISEEYIVACLETIKSYGPYMFIGEGFFLPHSNVSTANMDIGFSLIRLKEPLMLENQKEIRWISMMSAVDREKHLKALFTLGNLVQDKEYMRLLENAETVAEIEKIIKDYEYLKHPVSAY